MLIIEVSFFNTFWPFLTVMENKIKQLLNQEESKHKFKRFFEKIYRIRGAATIPRLFRLIHNNPSLDLT